MKTDVTRYTNRWFGYFDLLGFSNLVLENHIFRVLPIYESVLNTINTKAAYQQQFGVSYTWFSDAFILYTQGSSVHEFTSIEQVCRLFYQKLIMDEISVRGSLTVGPVYTNRKMHTYIGEALIDAYMYGEHQNWLGFALTPSVYDHLAETEIPVNKRAHYRIVPKNIMNEKKLKSKNTYAFAYNNGTVNRKNLYLRAIQSMKNKANSSNKIKYEYSTPAYLHTPHPT